MNEVSQTCSLCNKPNDQMLMLSCVHDPCINCAASAYAEQIHLKHQNKELYICEICGEQTLLDSSTVLELTALANSVIKLPSRAPKDTLSTIGKRKQTQLPQYPLVPTNSTSSKKIVYYCKEHSEEQISYYCFNCWTNICPECAIHGSHKDHQVKLIKKAISQVKGQYMDIVTKIGESQGNMSKLKDGFIRIIKDTHQSHSRQKNSVTRQFDRLRSILASKEKELLKELEELHKQNIATLTQFVDAMTKNHQEANKTRKNIEIITKKDDVLILQEYRKISDLQKSLAELNRNTENISGQLSHLNSDFMSQELKQIGDSVTVLQVNVKKENVSSKTFLGASRMVANST